MKKMLLLFAGFFSVTVALCQVRVGIKAGLNFANVTNASSINSTNKTGFMVGGFISPKIGSVGYRSELIFSRQGYNYKTNTNTGHVNLDYILLPQLLTLNLGRIITLQAGGQVAFLLGAGADSSNNTGGSGNPATQLMDYFKRIDYGFAIGGEFNLARGLMIGARYNISLGNVFASPTATQPNFIPRVDGKNNVVQLYAGLRIGGRRK